MDHQERARARHLQLARAAAIAAVAGILATSMAIPVMAKQNNGPIAFSVVRDGSPIANAMVTVRVEPAQSTWVDYGAGEPIDMPIVAQGLTNGSGVLRLAPAALVTGRANDEGEVNLLAVISSNSEAVAWWFPLQVVPSDRARVARQDAGSASDHRKAELTVDLGTHPGVADANDPPSEWSGAAEEQLTPSGLLAVAKTSAPGEIQPQQHCYYYWTNEWLYNRNVPVGDLWSWSGAPMSHSYDTSVGTTLGVALALSGGGMQASGTMSFNFTSGAGGEVTGLIDRRSCNQVNYRKMVDSCYLQGWWKPYQTTNILYPITYIGGQPNWEPNCGTYSSGYMYKTQGTNQTFSAGINLGPISVSAHTDWKTDNKLKWNFSASARLCGSTTAGWVSSPRAEAHSS